MESELVVLHVDDDDDIRVLVRLALETVGNLKVVQFASGPEALYNASSYEPDIILLDVMMPEMSGPELLSRLRTVPSFANLPAVFLTAKAAENELDALRGPGIAKIITKPFDTLALADELREICELHRRDLAS